ncbi:MAG: TRAP transporter substrate-binding protein, partial [Clostridiaceae bacterium]|nr:TRAP transporter substrate-binding protein [Clostridiaceae bacterium]
VLLGYGCSGVRIMTTNKPIHSIDDIKGLRLRVPTIDVYIKTWEWLKATPTPLGGSEIFTAIQQGTVDGQENSYIDSLNLGLHEVCKYATESNHAYITNCFIFDKKFFNSLPESCQQAMREAANEASEYKNRVLVDETAAAKQKFIDAGIEIIEVNTDEFMSYFNGFMEKHYPSLSKWREEILAMDPKGV